MSAFGGSVFGSGGFPGVNPVQESPVTLREGRADAAANGVQSLFVLSVNREGVTDMREVPLAGAGDSLARLVWWAKPGRRLWEIGMFAGERRVNALAMDTTDAGVWLHRRNRWVRAADAWLLGGVSPWDVERPCRDAGVPCIVTVATEIPQVDARDLSMKPHGTLWEWDLERHRWRCAVAQDNVRAFYREWARGELATARAERVPVVRMLGDEERGPAHPPNAGDLEWAQRYADAAREYVREERQARLNRERAEAAARLAQIRAYATERRGQSVIPAPVVQRANAVAETANTLGARLAGGTPAAATHVANDQLTDQHRAAAIELD